jgi:hypothetical protein
MNLYNNAEIAYSTDLQVFEDFSDDLKNEVSYGLEYILDEIFPDKKLEIIHDLSVDWFGLSDLII